MDWFPQLDLDAAVAPAYEATTVDGSGVYLADSGGNVSATVCPSPVPAGCVKSVNESEVALCNGIDDDCDGLIDENCFCTAGSVQRCFVGPPGHHGIGACQDGMQECIRAGDEFGGAWGACTGGIAPAAEACDGIDNDCNGCVDEVAGCVPVGTCPGPNDPRVPPAKPFTRYALRGADFYPGDARSWSWRIEGGPCDNTRATGQQSFELLDPTSMNATFAPKLSGDYTVNLSVVTGKGETFACTWIVHVLAPGLRIELCYPESETQDLDLFLKRGDYRTPWYTSVSDAGVALTPFSPSEDQCDWHNCEAKLRGGETTSRVTARADWGYANSTLSECSGGPQGAQWNALGYCTNPRLDIDNNLLQGSGLPENINLDAPREGESFRIMVQNFTGTIAHPIVNIYCGGRRAATYGAAPDQLTNFLSDDTGGAKGVGAMWRVADVTTHIEANGETSCEAVPLRKPGTNGYWVTVNDPSF